MRFIPETANRPDWARLVAAAVNGLQNMLGGVGVQSLRFVPSAAPANPSEGMVYMDSATHKLRCWNGSAWNDLF